MLDDEKCLCGSGRLYSMCCKPFSGQGIENYKKEIDSKNYIKAYYVAVAMLSDYLEDVIKNKITSTSIVLKQILRKSLIIKHLIISMKCKNIYIPLILLIIIEIINKQIISI